ncbi:XdhC family protein [Bacillus sp. BRMEA1]|uniref:XdhC family protein n=1 Tax=Neobacillus endophyticus TaxID=2738405 RepID=UPI0015639798|nr:XdhC/CoxI family protein [Neobacillus endophyticus]NRD79288.1 XdhC family protein [Neobacillus endophyticus]
MIHDSREKVLATIVKVKGSAYKKEGSMMVFLENHEQAGMLSAGCLETDLAIRALKVFENKKPAIIQFDMYDEGDLGWGQGVGCNGTIDILLESVTKKLHEDFIRVKELLGRNKMIVVLKNLDILGEYLYISEDKEAFGHWSGPIPNVNFAAKSGVMNDRNVFQQTYQPRPRLFVFGAGPDAIPLVSLAAEIGFSVYVCDWREEFCQQKYFPKAERLFVGFPKEVFKQFEFTSNDFVVIMTHNFQRDQEILTNLLHEKLKYLGILGPKERTRRLLETETIPDWIYAPIGLAIGAKGQNEIAVSIVAEMIEIWRKSIKRKIEHLWTLQE